MNDLVLPAFEMDCRDWLVLSPADAGMPDDIDGAPLLAVLSTLVIDDAVSDIREATGALTVGIIEEDEDLATREVAPGAAAHELLDLERVPGTRRYVMPAPNQRLALLAEFMVENDADELLDQRVEKLMTSFRWQTA